MPSQLTSNIKSTDHIIMFNTENTTNNKRLASTNVQMLPCKKMHYELASCDSDFLTYDNNDNNTVTSTASISSDNNTTPNTVCGKSIPLFLQKLYDLVETSSHDNVSKGIVSWNSADPTLFVIYDTKKFEQQIFKQFFTSTYSSFKRQLCYYGFKKITDGPLTSHIPKRGVVYRQDDGLFCRGRAELLSEVKRTSRVSDPKEEHLALRTKVDDLQQEVSELQKELIEMRSFKSEFAIMRAELFQLRQIAQSAKLTKPSRISRLPSLSLHVSENLVDERTLNCTVPKKTEYSVANPSSNQVKNLTINRPKFSSRDISIGSVAMHDLMQWIPRPMLDRDASTSSINSCQWISEEI